MFKEDNIIENLPSHNMEGEYVVLMETNGKECESWYYFIKKEGNEEALEDIARQLNMIESNHIVDELSVFDIDLVHTVSAKTAKEMTKLELNSYMFHRKFDGKLKKIDMGLKKKNKNDRKIFKVFDVLGYGQIEDYIDDEDLDSEDLISNSQNSSSEEESNSNSNSNSNSSSDESSDNTIDKKKIKSSIPPSLLNSNSNSNSNNNSNSSNSSNNKNKSSK